LRSRQQHHCEYRYQADGFSKRYASRAAHQHK
jgi:hypothetical protein